MRKFNKIMRVIKHIDYLIDCLYPHKPTGIF